ncbi:MAG: hypothetical protein FWD92_05355 [Methanomassiliicoccaceae archaeon]|nr:hypothetical protein [Methanomassiliicoccaceae archaeon]
MKCKYCNEKCATDFCGHGCEKRYDKFSTLVRKYGKACILGMLGPWVLLIPALFIFPEYIFFLAAVAFFIMAITLMILPFATSETVSLLGVKKSIAVVRLATIIPFISGLIILLYAL